MADYGLLAGSLGCGIPTTSISGFTGNLGFSNARVDKENSIQGSDSVSYTRGTHQFKFGMDAIALTALGSKVVDTLSGTVAFGATGFNAFNFTNGSTTSAATPLEDFLAGDPSSESIRAGSPVRYLTMGRYAAFAEDDWRIVPRLTLNLGLRWELQTAVHESNGLLGNFAPGTSTGMIQTNHLFSNLSHYEPRIGFAWDVFGHGRTVVRGGGSLMYALPQLTGYVAGGGNDAGSEPTGATLYTVNGAAIQPTGTITSVVTTPAPITSGSLITTSLPFTVSPTPIFTPVAQCGNGLAPVAPLAANHPAQNPAPCSASGGDPSLNPMFPLYLWHLNVQHALSTNTSIDVGYVGSHASDLAFTYNLNLPAPGVTGGTAEMQRRPYFSIYPWFNAINYYANLGSSIYHSLQITVTQRTSHGLTFNLNYGLSHALGQDSTITDVLAPKLDYGALPFDARHHLSLTAAWAIPGPQHSPGQMLQGWGLNGSINIVSALPLDITDTKDDVAGTGGGARWTLYGPATPFNKILGGAGTIPCYGLASSKLVASSGSPSVTVAAAANFPTPCITAATAEGTSPTTGQTGIAQLSAIGCYSIAGSAIVPPAQGTFGTMTPNELRGKGNGLLNLSVTKDWKFKERLTTQFRFEVFNVFNRTQYASAGINLGAPSAFGLATATPDVTSGNAVVGSGGPREAQLALRLTF